MSRFREAYIMNNLLNGKKVLVFTSIVGFCLSNISYSMEASSTLENIKIKTKNVIDKTNDFFINITNNVKEKVTVENIKNNKKKIALGSLSAAAVLVPLIYYRKKIFQYIKNNKGKLVLSAGLIAAGCYIGEQLDRWLDRSLPKYLPQYYQNHPADVAQQSI
jgi:hypothetical protein